MGYQIQYSPEYNKKYPIVKHKNPYVKLTKLLLPIVVLMLTVFTIFKSGYWRSWLIPDDSKLAITAFVEDIKAGESFKEAATSFCLEILENAKLES